MDDLLKGLLGADPGAGGLLATNLPTPYGLRAWKNQDGSYGGQMMPKGYGWLGVLKNPQGQSVTEYSLSDNVGDYPSLVPNTPPAELAKLLQGIVSPQQAQLAHEYAMQRRALGLSPFKEIWEK